MATKNEICTCHLISKQDRLVYNDNVDYYCPWCDSDRGEDIKEVKPVKKTNVMLQFRANSRMRGGGYLTFWNNKCGKKLTDVLTRFYDNGYSKKEFYFLTTSI